MNITMLQINEMAYKACPMENKPKDCANCMWKQACNVWQSAQHYIENGFVKLDEFIDELRNYSNTTPFIVFPDDVSNDYISGYNKGIEVFIDMLDNFVKGYTQRCISPMESSDTNVKFTTSDILEKQYTQIINDATEAGFSFINGSQYLSVGKVKAHKDFYLRFVSYLPYIQFKEACDNLKRMLREHNIDVVIILTKEGLLNNYSVIRVYPKTAKVAYSSNGDIVEYAIYENDSTCTVEEYIKKFSSKVI